jgi:hypothetical protein
MAKVTLADMVVDKPRLKLSNTNNMTTESNAHTVEGNSRRMPLIGISHIALKSQKKKQ